MIYELKILKNIFPQRSFFSGHRLRTEDNAHEIKHTTRPLTPSQSESRIDELSVVAYRE